MADGVWIGIDPGLSGGIAILHPADNFNPHVEAWCIPMLVSGDDLDIKAIATWITDNRFGKLLAGACIEKVHAMPDQGTVSMFRFGYVTGMIRGLIRSMYIPLYEVTPQAWKKEILAGTAKDKQAAIDFCLNTFPNINLFTTPKSRKHHDGMADATCIALYGYRKYR
jgi:hypothetical protein